MGKNDWGPLLDNPHFKAFLKIVAKRREEAVVECCTTKPGDTERIARAQERMADCDWILQSEFAGEQPNE